MARDDEGPGIPGSESGRGDGDRPAGAVADDDRATPHLAGQGRAVVDADGEDVGIVSDVAGETLYVEPVRTLTETIVRKLHWRAGDRDELEVPADSLPRIDDAVVLDVDTDGEGGSEPYLHGHGPPRR